MPPATASPKRLHVPPKHASQTPRCAPQSAGCADRQRLSRGPDRRHGPGTCQYRPATVDTILPDEDLEKETKSREEETARRLLRRRTTERPCAAPTAHLRAQPAEPRAGPRVSVRAGPTEAPVTLAGRTQVHAHDAPSPGHTPARRRDAREDTDARGKHAESQTPGTEGHTLCGSDHVEFPQPTRLQRQEVSASVVTGEEGRGGRGGGRGWRVQGFLGGR